MTSRLGDRRALVSAIAAVARLAEALGDRLASLEVNRVVGPTGRGAAATGLFVALGRSAPAARTGSVSGGGAGMTGIVSDLVREHPGRARDGRDLVVVERPGRLARGLQPGP